MTDLVVSLEISMNSLVLFFKDSLLFSPLRFKDEFSHFHKNPSVDLKGTALNT